jgi:hypothetical protein
MEKSTRESKAKMSQTPRWQWLTRSKRHRSVFCLARKSESLFSKKLKIKRNTVFTVWHIDQIHTWGQKCRDTLSLFVSELLLLPRRLAENLHPVSIWFSIVRDLLRASVFSASLQLTHVQMYNDDIPLILVHSDLVHVLQVRRDPRLELVGSNLEITAIGQKPYLQCTVIKIPIMYFQFPHSSVRERFQQNRQTDPGSTLIADKHFNVEIGTEASQFLLWEYLFQILWVIVSWQCLFLSH